MSVQYKQGLTLTPVHDIMPMAEGLSSVQPFTERLYTFWSNEFDQCAVFKFTLGVLIMAKVYSVVPFSGFSSIAFMMECYGVQYQYVRRIEKQYRRLYIDLLKRREEVIRTGGQIDPMGPAVFLYKCADVEGTLREFVIPRWAVRLLSTALAKCKPVPLSAVRNEFGHGRRTYSGAYVQCHQDYITFVQVLVTPLIELRIRGEEFRIRGRMVREYAGSRQVGHTGRERLFSDSDITDIVDKTMLMVYTPLLVRTVPLRGVGYGIGVMERCTVTMQDAARTYRRYDVQRDLYRNDTEQGYICTFTDQMTGESVQAFTQSYSQAEYFCTMKGCTGTIGDVEAFMSDDDSPVNGNPALYEHTDSGEFNPDSIIPFRAERVFNSVLIGMIRTQFRSLHRRTDREDKMISEHKKKRDMRRSNSTDVPLYALLSAKVAGVDGRTSVYELIDKLVQDGQLSTHEAAVCEVELMPTDELKVLYGPTGANLDSRFWKYEAFMDACSRLIKPTAADLFNGKDVDIPSPRRYYRLRQSFLHKIAQAYSGAEKPKGVKRTPVPLVRNVRLLPLWKRERKLDKRSPDQVIADSLNCGVSRAVPQYNLNRPTPRTESYFVYDNELGMMYVRPYEALALHQKMSWGYRSTPEYISNAEIPAAPVNPFITPTEQCIDVQHVARRAGVVRAFTGRLLTTVGDENYRREDHTVHPFRDEIELTVQVNEIDTVQVYIPVWKTEVETDVKVSSHNHVVTQQECTPVFDAISQNVTVAYSEKVITKTSGKPYYVRGFIERMYTEYVMPEGDGI